MKTKTKRLLGLFLSLAMIFALADFSALSPAYAESTQDPITLSVGVVWCDYGNGVHTDQNAFLQKLKAETGVELDFVVFDTDLWSVMAASGDFCDIMLMTSPTAGAIETAMKSGAVLPLDDLLDQYGQQIKEDIPDALESVRLDDGHIYGFPTHVSYANDTPQRNGWIGFQARYDIYKAIGSPEIKNEDDWLAALKQMVDYERARTGNDDIYGLSGFVDWGTWPYYIQYPFSYGLMDKNSGGYDRATGEYVDFYMDENSVFWKGMAFYNKAYRMGIFDVDGITQKYQQHKDKVATGKLLASGYGYDVDQDVCGKDAIMTYLPGSAFPDLCGTYNVAYPVGYQLEASVAISSNCKYPERAMQVLNYISSEEGALWYRNGVQGEDWDYVDGKPTLLEPMKQAIMGQNADENYRRDRTGDPLCWTNLYTGIVKTENGFSSMDLSMSEDFIAETATPQQKSFAQDFDASLSYPGQVYRKWIEEGTVTDVKSMDGAMKTSFLDTPSEEAARIMAEREEYNAANISKLIMAETEEEFEAVKASFIQKYHEMGYEKAVEEDKALFEASFAKYEELYGK